MALLGFAVTTAAVIIFALLLRASLSLFVLIAFVGFSLKTLVLLLILPHQRENGGFDLHFSSREAIVAVLHPFIVAPLALVIGAAARQSEVLAVPTAVLVYGLCYFALTYFLGVRLSSYERSKAKSAV